jgi:ubiquinone/menaquinone biosynthesis C-methylase UbiE/ADP-ribose pyrophosphatase YjhB (NUDIX family)
MPELLSAALIERAGCALTAHRKAARPPFAGEWVLPITEVGADEAAEDALRRHAREQFGVDPGGGEEFVETVYLEDAADSRRYIANIFRTPLSGPMRFNADGDYDDARWLAASELGSVSMPAAMRDPLMEILGDPDRVPGTNWERYGGSRCAQPLGELAPPAQPAPDNRAAWDAFAGAYQRERYGDRGAGELMWSWRASERQLGVLGDVRGKRAIVLGCGGGQDVVALTRMGAVGVGVDFSREQLAYARDYAARHEAANASFAECDMADLSRFDDASFDLAVSIHALDFVGQIADVLECAARIVKSGGILAIAIKHPFDLCVDATGGGAPFFLYAPYWTRHEDWTWEVRETSARFRRYQRTIGEWVDRLDAAGFSLERLIEPKEDALPRVLDDELSDAWLAMVPYTLVIKARRR